MGDSYMRTTETVYINHPTFENKPRRIPRDRKGKLTPCIVIGELAKIHRR
jgi:hypothetical protein